MKKNQKYSIRYILVLLVSICWVLPIVMLFSFAGTYINTTLNKQIHETLNLSIRHGENVVKKNMDYLINISRKLSYDYQIRNAYFQYEKDEDRISLYHNTKRYLDEQYKYDTFISASILYYTSNPNDVYYTYNETQMPNQYTGSYENVKDYLADFHKDVQEISKTLDSKIKFVNYNDKLYMVRNVLDRNFKPYAVLIFDLNIPSIFDSFAIIPWQECGTVLINDVTINLFKDHYIDTGLFRDRMINNKIIIERDNDIYYAFGKSKSDDFELGYILKIDRVPLISELTQYRNLTYTMIMFLVPILGILVWFLYVNIAKPISKLSHAYTVIEEGNLGYTLSEDFSNKEFHNLRNAFNNMSMRIKQQFDRIYNQELAYRDAKIEALQSQINPHYINNTLEIINWEARLSGNDKISKMIEALSTMLDMAMDRESNHFVTLNEELSHLDAYLYILAYRYGDNLEIKKDIASDVLNECIPKLILQPIIENAIEHGIKPMKKGVVTIKAYKEECLIIEIVNDGEFTKEDEIKIDKLLQESKKGESIGISNVNTRIKMIYGENSGLTITREDGKTVSRLKLYIVSQ